MKIPQNQSRDKIQKKQIVPDLKPIPMSKISKQEKINKLLNVIERIPAIHNGYDLGDIMLEYNIPTKRFENNPQPEDVVKSFMIQTLCERIRQLI